MGKCHKPGLLWFSEAQPLKGYQHTSGSAAKSLQSCPTLCDPIGGSPPGSSIAGTLQARTLEWVAISFSNAWKWKVKVNSLSRVWLFATPWTATHQAPPSMGFSRQEYWSGVPMKQTNPLLLESRKAQDTTGLHCESVRSGKTMGKTVTSSRVLRDKSRWGRWAARTEKQLHHTCGEAGSLGPWRSETHPRNSSKGTCYRVKKTDTRQVLQTLPKLTDVKFSSVQFSCVRLFVTPWTAARQASLSITNSESSLKLMSIELVMPSSHLILCCPLLLLPSIFLASGSFPMSQLFASGGQSTGVSASASVLPMNTQDWSPSGWTGCTSSQSKGLSRVFSNTTVQKHQFFSAQLSL